MTTAGHLPLLFGARVENELLDEVGRGSQVALAELYDAHAEPIYAFARRLVGDDFIAEDLVHEVFVTLPRAARSFRGDSTLRTFLLSIAVNLARHHVRSATRRRAAMERFGEEPQQSPTAPDREAERRELAAALQRALDQLPIDQRIAFVLCEVEQHTSGQAAAIVGAPEGTVRTRVFHAKKKLRELLGDDHEAG
jgi:RNA polymerase sigma-70 factor (ECF subfamily)